MKGIYYIRCLDMTPATTAHLGCPPLAACSDSSGSVSLWLLLDHLSAWLELEQIKNSLVLASNVTFSQTAASILEICAIDLPRTSTASLCPSEETQRHRHLPLLAARWKMRVPAKCFAFLVIPIAVIVFVFFLRDSYSELSWDQWAQVGLQLAPSRVLSHPKLQWSQLGDYGRRPGGEEAACEVLPWPLLEPEGLDSPCHMEQYCGFVFRNACVRINEGSEDEHKEKWLVEVDKDCTIPEGLGPHCALESGSSGDNIRLIHPDQDSRVDPGPNGFDPMPTTFLDRSGGQPGNFYHDTAIAFYPLYLNMLMRGWDDYSGRRIAVVDMHGLPPDTQNGFDSYYYAYNQSETSYWPDFTDRKCFAEVTFIRTTFGWKCGDHRVVPQPALNGYASFIAKHFGVSPEPAPLPVSPSLFYMHRGGSTGRKVNNWEELAASMDIPYKVHNMSQTMKEQIEQMRNSSIIFGAHGAGLSLLLHAPIGAVIIGVYSAGHEDPRMFRNQAVLSGRHFIRHIVRDEKAIHPFTPYGAPLNSSAAYHYANIELSKSDFHHLLDTAIQMLVVQNQVAYLSTEQYS